MRQIANNFLIIFKHWIMSPMDIYKANHTICCSKCYKKYYQFKSYRVGQVTLCKKCKEDNLHYGGMKNE